LPASPSGGPATPSINRAPIYVRNKPIDADRRKHFRRLPPRSGFVQHFSRANSQSRFSSDLHGFFDHIHSFIASAFLAVAHLYPLGRMGAIAVIGAWGLLASLIALLATRLLTAWYQRKRVDATGRIILVATLFAVVVVDLLLFQGDLFRREKWGMEGKGAYLWYLFPLATLFFCVVAGVTSGVVKSYSREGGLPK
jgi:hypothetical protein